MAAILAWPRPPDISGSFGRRRSVHDCHSGLGGALLGRWLPGERADSLAGKRKLSRRALA